MNKKNLIVSILLVGVMILSSFSVFAATSFSDVKSSDWFYTYVSKAVEKNIVAGYPDGTFRPQNQVTYAEFITMAMRGEKASNLRGRTEWYAPYYYAAIDNGIFYEYQIAYRQMSKPIPRKDMAVVMAGVLAYNNLDAVKTVNAGDTFSDISSTSEYEYPIALCNYYGALSGYPDGTFRPNNTLTRAEAATAMVALVDVVEKYNPGEVTPEVPQDPEKPYAEPKDRETLVQYMTQFRKGIDGHYDNGVFTAANSNVVYPRFKKTTNASLDASKFINPEINNYLLGIAKTIKFTKSGDFVSVSYSWPDALSGMKSGSIECGVHQADGTQDVAITNLIKHPEAGSKSYTCSAIKLSNAKSVRVTIAATAVFGQMQETATITYDYVIATKRVNVYYTVGGMLTVNSDASYSVTGTGPAPVSTIFSGIK